MNSPFSKILYRGCEIISNRYCSYIIGLSNKPIFFFQGGNRDKQIQKCKEEIDAYYLDEVNEIR